MKFLSSVAVAMPLLCSAAFGSTGYFVTGDDALLLKNPTGIYNVVTVTASVPGIYNNFRQLTLPPDGAMFVYSVSSLGVVVNGDTFIQIDSCYDFKLSAYNGINQDGSLIPAPVTPIGTSQDCPKEGGSNGGSSGSGLGSDSGSGSSTGGTGSGSGSGSSGGTGSGSSGGTGSGGDGNGGSGGAGGTGGSTGGGSSSGGSGSGNGSGSGSGSGSGGSGGSGGGSGLPKHCTDGHGRDGAHSETCEQ